MHAYAAYKQSSHSLQPPNNRPDPPHLPGDLLVAPGQEQAVLQRQHQWQQQQQEA